LGVKSLSGWVKFKKNNRLSNIGEEEKQEIAARLVVALTKILGAMISTREGIAGKKTRDGSKKRSL